MSRRSAAPAGAASTVKSFSPGRKEDQGRSRLKPLLQANHLVHVGYAVPRTGMPSAVSFRHWVDAALRGAKRRKATELSIRLVDANEGRMLNRDYRDKDYATNVLSFPVELPPEMKLPLIGDLAICAPVVQREAAEQGKPPRNHWAHMTVHGVLHLLGYDHIEEHQAETMEALETRILASLGIPDPYTVAPHVL